MNTPPPIPDADPKARAVRRLGWFLIVIGPGLCIAMTVIAFNLYFIVYHPNLSGNHERWTGTPEFARTMFQLFGAIFVFGLAALAAGIYQVRQGRRHPVIIGFVLVIVGVIGYLVNTIISTGPATP